MNKRRVSWLLIFSLFLSVGLSPAASAAGQLNCRSLPGLMRVFLVQHVRINNFNDDIKKRTVEQYLKTLDPSKTLFAESDAQKIRAELPKIFESMKAGDCKQLDDYQALALARAKENEAFAKEFLGKGYKFDETVELTIDPEKRGYAPNLDERKKLLQKFIHFQISNYLSAGETIDEAKKNLAHRYELAVKNISERGEDERLADFSNAFATALDPHSNYMSADVLEDFRINMSLSLEGIGASLSSQDGFTVVEEIIPGGAADKAKTLMPKDKIIAVGQGNDKPETVIDMPLRDVVKKIRGKKGSTVKLIVLRRKGAGTDRLEIPLVRDKVSLKDEEAKLSWETRTVDKQKLKIAVIDLPSFYGDSQSERSSYEDVKKLVEQAAKQKADGILLNLIRNGGGLLDDAVRIGGLFIKEGPIVATQSKSQNSDRTVNVLKDTDPGVLWNGPLVILISRRSASASEILSGALRDYKRAVVVGADHTFGKGSVQAVMPLRPGMGAIKVTTGMFYIPGGDSTQGKGVAAHVTLPSIFSTDEFGESTLDYALPPDTIKPFLGVDANTSEAGKRWLPVEDTLVKRLADKSAARVAKDPKFKEVLKEIEEAKQSKGIVKLAEVKKKADKDKAAKKDEKPAIERMKEADAPHTNEAINVLVDLISDQRSPPVAAK